MKPLLLTNLTCLLLAVIMVLEINRREELQIVFCDVGQGDAILLQLGRVQVLIDGGPDQEVLRCLGEYMPWLDREIELIVATHPDADHIGGLFDVISSYQVQYLVWTGESKETDDFKRLYELVQAKKEVGLVVMEAKNGQIFKLATAGFLKIICLFTENTLQDAGQKEQNNNFSINDGSIALLLEYKQTKSLFMADIEAGGEQALISNGLLNNVDLLKVGHHGSKSATSLPLLLATQPEISIISVGKNNQYGHPSPEVVSRLEAIGTILMRTDQLGDIELRTKGTTFVFQNASK